MLYLALTFWILAAVLMAWGVHRLWTGLVRSKIVNVILLPGTLAGQLGHVLGLLVTGATVTNATLYKDDESGDPETTPNPQPRIPVIGPIIIGLLPLLACGTAVYFTARELGRPITRSIDVTAVGPILPTTLAGVWQLLRDQISLVETLVAAVSSADFHNWKTCLFVYLLICMTVRMAPFAGNLRGSLGAIVLLGVGAAALTRLFDVADPRIQSAWGVLNLTIGALLFLLFVSLLFRGVVGLILQLRQNA